MQQHCNRKCNKLAIRKNICSIKIIFYIKDKIMFIEQAIEKLKKNNQKITATRLWILHQIENTKKAINPYELLAQDTNATIDITTIYRNFELFEKLGIVHKIQSSG
jgi:Fe2+ or Zn2+ uptake regulation protein